MFLDTAYLAFILAKMIGAGRHFLSHYKWFRLGKKSIGSLHTFLMQ